MKPNTVLIPLDGSAFSRQVLPHIRRIFIPDQYALILLRVEQAPEGVTAAPARLVLVNNTLVSLYESRTDANLARHPIRSMPPRWPTASVPSSKTSCVRRCGRSRKPGMKLQVWYASATPQLRSLTMLNGSRYRLSRWRHMAGPASAVWRSAALPSRCCAALRYRC